MNFAITITITIIFFAIIISTIDNKYNNSIIDLHNNYNKMCFSHNK